VHAELLERLDDAVHCWCACEVHAELLEKLDDDVHCWYACEA
jgi:hypothetical protein